MDSIVNAKTSVEIINIKEVVYEWICRMSAYSDFPLTDSIIKSMASQFKAVLNMHWFYASTEWVKSFRFTYKLKSIEIAKHYGYKQKKSVQVQDIVREMMATRRSVVNLPVRNEPIDVDEHVVDIIEIADEIKLENDMGLAKNESLNLLQNDTEIVDQSQSFGIDTIHPVCSDVDFEKELPSSVVPNHSAKNRTKKTTPKKRDDIEDSIPALVCSPPLLVQLPIVRRTPIDQESSKKKKPRLQTKPKNPTPKFILPKASQGKESVPPTQVLSTATLLPVCPAIKIVNPMETINIPSNTASTNNPINIPSVSAVQILTTTPVPVPVPVSIHKVNVPSSITIKKLECSATARKLTRFSKKEPLKTREEALKCLKMMEEFALMKENFRLIGFIERLEKLIKNRH